MPTIVHSFRQSRLIYAIVVSCSVILCALWCSSCTTSTAPPPASPSAGISILHGGETITMSKEQAGRFETLPTQEKPFTGVLKVPAHVVATSISSNVTTTPLVLLENDIIEQLYGDFRKSRAGYARAQTQYLRLKELVQNNAASGKDLLDAETDMNQNFASLQEAESKLLQLGIYTKELNEMKAGEALLICDIPESRIGGVKAGESTIIEFNALPSEQLHGRVTSIGSSIDPQTRTIKVGIELSSRGGKIKPGMFAKESITENETLGISVPRTAVVNAEAKTFVFVCTADTVFSRRAVVIAGDNAEEFFVVSGLNKGERLVTKNAILLKGLSFGY